MYKYFFIHNQQYSLPTNTVLSPLAEPKNENEIWIMDYGLDKIINGIITARIQNTLKYSALLFHNYIHLFPKNCQIVVNVIFFGWKLGLISKFSPIHSTS